MGVDVGWDMVFRIVEGFVTALFVLLWWLYQQREKSTQEQLKKLWEEHEKDVRRLQDVELEIAKHHYIKGELDEKFSELRMEIRNGLNNLGDQLKLFTTALLKDSKKD